MNDEKDYGEVIGFRIEDTDGRNCAVFKLWNSIEVTVPERNLRYYKPTSSGGTNLSSLEECFFLRCSNAQRIKIVEGLGFNPLGT